MFRRQSRSTAACENRAYFLPNQFGCHCWKPLIHAICPPIFNRDVPAFFKPTFAET